MNEIFVSSVYFGCTLSLLAFWSGLVLQKRTGLALCNPLLISIIIIILILKVFGIDYASYNQGAQYITYLLTPATVCLALPLYRQLKILKKYFIPLIMGALAGCLTCLGLVVALAYLLKLNDVVSLSLLPKSITTAIAIGVAEELGGIAGITVAAVIITGVFSALIATTVFRVFHIHNPVAQGLALGAAGHAIGTSRALEMGEVQGAMGSLAIVVMGIMTVILAPIAANFL